MGSADQARNLNSLLQMCNIRQKYDKYKHTQLPQILLSESYTSNYVAVLENDYVNLFDNALDRTMLINLSSGSEMETPTKLLRLQQNDITLARVSSKMFSKSFLIPFLETSISQWWWGKSILQRQTGWPQLKSRETS